MTEIDYILISMGVLSGGKLKTGVLRKLNEFQENIEKLFNTLTIELRKGIKEKSLC